MKTGHLVGLLVCKAVLSVYILSTGRTGTSSIAGILGRLFPEHRVSHERAGTRILNILANMNSVGYAPRGLFQFFWNRAFKDEEPFVEVNNFLWRASSLAGRPEQNDLIIHVVRDPRDYIESHMNISQQRLKSYLANQWVPFWQPRLQLGQRSNTVLDEVSKFAAIWALKNSYLDRYESTKYCLVRFEDLFSNTPEAYSTTWEPLVAKIEKALGASAQIENFDVLKQNESGFRAGQGWRQWNNERARCVDSLCGSQARAYGYLDEPEWEKLLQGDES